MKTAKHTALTTERITTVKRIARRAANRELRGEARGFSRDWWVSEYSFELGIIDHMGMVDMHGEAARLFDRERERMVRAC